MITFYTLETSRCVNICSVIVLPPHDKFRSIFDVFAFPLLSQRIDIDSPMSIARKLAFARFYMREIVVLAPYTDGSGYGETWGYKLQPAAAFSASPFRRIKKRRRRSRHNVVGSISINASRNVRERA